MEDKDDFMCMSVLSTHIYVHHISVCCPQSLEEQ